MPLPHFRPQALGGVFSPPPIKTVTVFSPTVPYQPYQPEQPEQPYQPQPVYGNFDIILAHFSRISQPHVTAA